MSTESDRLKAVKDHLLFILIFNAFFWLLSVTVSMTHLRGQECFEKVFPVVVGGSCLAIVAVISAWRQRRFAA